MCKNREIPGIPVEAPKMVTVYRCSMWGIQTWHITIWWVCW